jgi:protein SCO1
LFTFVAAALLILIPSVAAAQYPTRAPGAKPGPGAQRTLPSETPPPMLEEVAFEQRLDAQLPLDTVFRDESGAAVRLGDYFGDKPVILSLVYYDCPMLCTIVLNGLTQSLNAVSFDIGNQFRVVTVSFDPEDTPEMAAAKKQAYVQRYGRTGAADGWHFLTGDEASIRELTDAVGFRYAYDARTGEYAHASGIMVATPEGRLARYFYGVDYPSRDVRLGLIEASQNRIGNPVDQVLLYCFEYDPTTGGYGLVILRLIRLGGIVTVALLGSFVIVMLRRDRRQDRAATP